MSSKLVSVIAVALGLVAGQAGAATYNFTLNPSLSNQAVSFSSALSATGGFSDEFNFTFTGPDIGSSGAATALQVYIEGSTPDVDFISATLNGVAAGTLSNEPVGSSGVSLFATPLIAESSSNAPAYQLLVSGIGQSGAVYAGTLNIALIPEPGSCAMMFAGLVAIGRLALRRRKA